MQRTAKRSNARHGKLAAVGRSAADVPCLCLAIPCRLSWLDLAYETAEKAAKAAGLKTRASRDLAEATRREARRVITGVRRRGCRAIHLRFLESDHEMKAEILAPDVPRAKRPSEPRRQARMKRSRAYQRNAGKTSSRR